MLAKAYECCARIRCPGVVWQFYTIPTSIVPSIAPAFHAIMLARRLFRKDKTRTLTFDTVMRQIMQLEDNKIKHAGPVAGFFECL